MKKYTYTVLFDNNVQEAITAVSKKAARQELERLKKAGCAPKIKHLRKKY